VRACGTADCLLFRGRSLRLTSFRITNFKGIVDSALDLASEPKSQIYVLVGLNESGKTTILESLSFFAQNLELQEDLSLAKGVVDDVHSLIPKGKKDNFTDKVVLKARMSLDARDIASIKDAMRTPEFVVTEIPAIIDFTQHYEFANSQFVKKTTTWTVGWKAKKPGERKQRSLTPAELAKAWAATRKRLPLIIYYPNFLFAFPDRIFLEPSDGEANEQIFYRRVIQDVLDSLENKLDVGTHIVKRARSDSKADADALESVLNKASAQITRVVFSPDFTVFRSDSLPRSIILSTPKVDPKSNLLYLEVKLKEGDDSFYIRERSLGFQWFFTFLLFTKFRTHRQDPNRELIFLLDEPASNLHQTAQQRLVRALSQLTSANDITVIYSTHSHHLIDPKWLSSAFVVRNKGLDYDSDDAFSAKMTDIVADRYRTFVGQYPNLRTYFQPILDLLEYRPSNLEAVPEVVMLEGKSDYNCIRYLSQRVDAGNRLPHMVPGAGAGSLDSVIQLYVGWGSNFVVLLDSDREGINQKRRYDEKFGNAVRGRVFTLADINPAWKGQALESILPLDDRMLILQSRYPEVSDFDKKRFHLAIEELSLNAISLELSDDGEAVVRAIVDFVAQSLEKSRTD
jgi:energy-coupling factor transporter ATP-binding protein EcfA2